MPLVRSELTIPYSSIAALAAADNVQEASAMIRREFRDLCARNLLRRRRRRATQRHDAVGPWRRCEEDGVVQFTKEADAESALWARMERIPQQKRGRRVVLIGESVARALFLDPLFNCAGALQTMCASVAGEKSVELVDLARNGLVPKQALELIASAKLLNPDVYVVFAGNNFPRIPPAGDASAARAATALRATGSWRAVTGYPARFARRQAQLFVTRLAASARAQNVPLVYVIPAYNQRDWRFDAGWTSPLLTHTEQMIRGRRLRQAEVLLEEGQLDEVERVVLDALRGEEIPSPWALQLLGHVSQARHANDEARKLFDSAANAVSALLVPTFRLCTPVVAETLREHDRTDVTMVDLPRLFEDVHGGKPVGREFFLDHIHLSHQGVQCAMAGVAEKILPLLGLPARSHAELYAAAAPPNPDANAQAHFMAAWLNAASGQPAELVRYHTQRAVAATPAILPAIDAYVRRTLRRVPDALCADSEAVPRIREQFPAIARIITRPRRDAKRVHPELLRVWHGITRRDGGQEGEMLDPSLPNDYAIGPTAFDLLDGRLEDGRDFGLLSLFGVRTILTSRDSQSAFWFCWQRPSSCLRLQFVSRVRGLAAGRRVVVTLNDRPVYDWIGSDRWRQVDCIVSEPALRAGENVLRILWPDPGYTHADHVARMAALLEGASPVYPAALYERQIYAPSGEISRFVARAVETPENQGATGLTAAIGRRQRQGPPEIL